LREFIPKCCGDFNSGDGGTTLSIINEWKNTLLRVSLTTESTLKSCCDFFMPLKPIHFKDFNFNKQKLNAFDLSISSFLYYTKMNCFSFATFIVNFILPTQLFDGYAECHYADCRYAK
jgi:hypothetical protein